MRNVPVLLLLAALVFTAGACSGTAPAVVEGTANSGVETGPSGSTVTGVDLQRSVDAASPTISVEYERDDLEVSTDNADLVQVRLEGDSITVEGSGATVDGSILTITAAGTYNISGTLDDGQIIVETQDEETVYLILDGADITCSTSAPLYVSNAEKTVITLAGGSENTITDGTAYVFDDAESDEPNAAVFSKDDLTINGTGSLTVNANYNNGIASKDDLKITGGTIIVDAVNDGIKGRDSIAVLAGEITVSAGADGLQANNDEDPEKGTIAIDGGTFAITAGLDGIQAETGLLVSDGTISIVTGGGSVDSAGGDFWGGRGMEGNPNQTTESVKGLKAGTSLTISGGVIEIDALDDAVHSNDSITINGGKLLLASGDDGIHADNALTISGGDLNITRSYEGLESTVITINDGTIHLQASDDGINASSGTGDAMAGGRPARGGAPGGFETGDNFLYIHGGYVFVDANGDGLDVNGPFEMTGGMVIVNGPTSDWNGPLDYLGTFNISGGYLVAVGSAGMAQAPSTTSTQYSVMFNYSSPQAAGRMVHIETESGEDVVSFVPAKQYQSVLVSSPDLEKGSSYGIYSGGSSSGTVTDGLYVGGSHSGGSQVGSFTISSIVTGGGRTAGGFSGGGRPRP